LVKIVDSLGFCIGLQMVLKFVTKVKFNLVKALKIGVLAILDSATTMKKVVLVVHLDFRVTWQALTLQLWQS